jgi:hypothetical protein
VTVTNRICSRCRMLFWGDGSGDQMCQCCRACAEAQRTERRRVAAEAVITAAKTLRQQRANWPWDSTLMRELHDALYDALGELEDAE